jgi:hypothetical protein
MSDYTIKVIQNKSRHEYRFNLDSPQALKLHNYLKKMMTPDVVDEPRGTLAGLFED